MTNNPNKLRERVITELRTLQLEASYSGAELQDQLEPAEIVLIADAAIAATRAVELRKVLTPRMWTREMSDAWHQALPDTEAAFAALLDQLDGEEGV